MYGYGGYFYFQLQYLLFLLPGLLLGIWAQVRVKSTFSKYNQVRTLQGLTGAQAARRILDANGLHHVQVQVIQGSLSDHFDPKTNTISLSADVYGSATVGAVGVAAHECGHAIQYATQYAPIKLRTSIVPVVNLGSAISWPLMIVGLIFSFPELIYAGIALFSLVVLFQLVTLPVELNASKRAVQTLDSTGMLTMEENNGVKKVLSAAALTYVAALLTSILQLLYYLTRFGGSRRR